MNAFTKFDLDWFINNHLDKKCLYYFRTHINEKEVLDIIDAFSTCIVKEDLASPENVIIACDFIKHYVMYNTISSVKITDDCFSSAGKHENSYILTKDDNGNIINHFAYNFHVRHIYQDFAKKEIEMNEHYTRCNYDIYVYKGGIITGDVYSFKNIRIYGELYDIPKIITIPASTLMFEKENGKIDTIFIVDHREPALAKVLNTYEMNHSVDTYIKNRKFSLRKYEKIKN